MPNVNTNRHINTFPQSFLQSATPYKTTRFSSYSHQAAMANPGIGLTKVIFVGDVTVGKTSLLNRFCHQIYLPNYKATIGVDFEIQRFQILDSSFLLQIWDTAGQERFKSITQTYYRGATVIVLVFSLSEPTSLYNTYSWLADCLKANDSSPVIFLVGTKRDLVSSSEYKKIESEAINAAEDMNAEYWSVSSKTGDCVEQFFSRLASLAFEYTAHKIFSTRDGRIPFGDPITMLTLTDMEYETNENNTYNNRPCYGSCIK